jgi:hypothetical protein
MTIKSNIFSSLAPTCTSCSTSTGPEHLLGNQAHSWEVKWAAILHNKKSVNTILTRTLLSGNLLLCGKECAQKKPSPEILAQIALFRRPKNSILLFS